MNNVEFLLNEVKNFMNLKKIEPHRNQFCDLRTFIEFLKLVSILKANDGLKKFK